MTTQAVNDREAISEVKARYCRFLDTKQWDAWADLFTEDFVLDTSEGGGPPAITGRDAAVDMVRQSIECVLTAHQVHSPEIVITDESAEVIWAMQDRLIFEGGHGIVGYGHYTETYVKQGGDWKIARSKLTRLLVEQTAPQS
jgi:ketosteroid isomerase-like protein